MAIKVPEPNKVLAENVQHNDFTRNLGKDWFAVDAAGHPFARASDEDSLRRAAPSASGYFTAADFDNDAAEKAEADDKPNKAEMDHDGNGTRGGSRQRKPADK